MGMKDIILRQKFERDRYLARDYIPRDKLGYAQQWLRAELIKVIVGPRRAGKSTFAFMLLKDVPFMYFNFDEEAIHLLEDADKLLEALHAVYGDVNTVFFDEIQNLPRWELFVSRLYREGYNVILTGSNARLLSGELTTALTGRHIPIEIMPFNFQEFLRARGVNINQDELALPHKKGGLLKLVYDYMVTGGFPEVILNNFDFKEYLRILFEAIVFKDIVRRYNVRYSNQIVTLAEYLINNFSRHYTSRKIKNVLDMKSVTTVEKYLSYLEEAFLFVYLRRFYYKPTSRIKSPRKVYVIDNGYITSMSLRFSEDRGRLMENLVITELIKQGVRPNVELFYYNTRNNREVDLVIKKGMKVSSLIQVTYGLSSQATADREVRSLIEASDELNCHDLTILTWDYEKEETEKGKTIRFIPLWKWLLRG